MSKDQSEGVLFAFRTYMTHPAHLPILHPRGLDPLNRYEIEGIPGSRSGAGWMHGGVELELDNFDSTVRPIRRI
jgi:hypothetical protein